MLVDEGGAAPHVAWGDDHCWQYLKLDLDGFGEVLRFGPGRGDASGDRLADIADLVGGERWPGGRLGARRLGDDADRLDARQIRRGKDAALALGRRRDPTNAGMRMRAADERHLHRAGQFDVRYEFAAAMQVALVLAAQQRGA